MMANECVELTDIFLKLTRENESLKAQLAEAQSYKADAEYYRWIRENWQKFLAIVDSWPVSRLEEGIEQAIEESKLTKGVSHE